MVFWWAHSIHTVLICDVSQVKTSSNMEYESLTNQKQRRLLKNVLIMSNVFAFQKSRDFQITKFD